jgi:hypothetical protein
MTRQQEENLMGWMLVVIGIIAIVGILNATPTQTTQDTPCKHSH